MYILHDDGGAKHIIPASFLATADDVAQDEQLNDARINSTGAESIAMPHPSNTGYLLPVLSSSSSASLHVTISISANNHLALTVVLVAIALTERWRAPGGISITCGKVINCRVGVEGVRVRERPLFRLTAAALQVHREICCILVALIVGSRRWEGVGAIVSEQGALLPVLEA
mmetsp:Transcript_29755/g.41484  ORF Transcript_29755/g.41484 Transcript_29755/m.41484 type:complete len:172 (+) Transcript_29755:37-552(+)